MSIATELTRLSKAKSGIATSITNQGVTVPAGTKLDAYPALIDSIKGLTPAPEPYVWEKPSDWPDIVSIFNADVQPGYTKAYIMLLPDASGASLALPGSASNIVGGSAWKTSDGQFYTSATMHVWDESQDIDCPSRPYKLRWVIVYHSSPVSVTLRGVKCVWVYFDCNVSYMAFGDTTTTNANGLLEQVTFSENARISDPLPAYCFDYCSNLRSFSFPNAVTTIGASAFQYCVSLKSVTFKEGITTFGSQVFSGCTNLTEVIIPESVTSLNNNTFEQCRSLCKVKLPSNYVGSLGTGLLTNCTNLEEVEIPAGVTSLGESCFSSCVNLRSIVLPSGLTTLGQYCFSACSSLPEMTIPSGVTDIPTNCFSNCVSLRKLILPDGLTSFGIQSINVCYSLKELTIPAGVTAVPSSFLNSCYSFERLVFRGITSMLSAFGSMSALKEIILEGTFTSLPASFCGSNYALEHVKIPATVVSIGSSPFLGCTRVTNFELDGTGFDVAISLSAMALLTRSSLLTLLAALKDNTGVTAKTLTLGTTNLAKLTADEKAVATNKNWNLA